MRYSFLSDEEPTDEQLLTLMQEVGEDVRRESEQLNQLVKDKLEEEYARILAAHKKQP
jgi:hypothetical protein